MVGKILYAGQLKLVRSIRAPRKLDDDCGEELAKAGSDAESLNKAWAELCRKAANYLEGWGVPLNQSIKYTLSFAGVNLLVEEQPAKLLRLIITARFKEFLNPITHIPGAAHLSTAVPSVKPFPKIALPASFDKAAFVDALDADLKSEVAAWTSAHDGLLDRETQTYPTVSTLYEVTKGKKFTTDSTFNSLEVAYFATCFCSMEEFFLCSVKRIFEAQTVMPTLKKELANLAGSDTGVFLEYTKQVTEINRALDALQRDEVCLVPAALKQNSEQALALLGTSKQKLGYELKKLREADDEPSIEDVRTLMAFKWSLDTDELELLLPYERELIAEEVNKLVVPVGEVAAGGSSSSSSLSGAMAIMDVGDADRSLADIMGVIGAALD